METKLWYKSKTLWVNLLVLIGTIAGFFGVETTEWMAISSTALAVINIILRAVTNEEIVWTEAKSAE